MAKQHDAPYRLYKRGETYHAYISFIGDNGTRIHFRCSCQTTRREQAEKFVIKKISEIQNQNTVQSGGSIKATINQTFARYYTEKSIYQTRPNQALTRLNNLKEWLGITYLTEISEPVIAKMISAHRHSFAPATINRYLALLSVVLNTARDEWKYNVPYIKLSKFKLKEPAENIKYLKDWQSVQRIIDGAQNWFKPIIYTAVYTGLRLGNLLNLTWDQVDFANRRINIKVKDNQTFGGKNHSVPIIEKLYNILSQIEPVSNYVFTHNGKKLNSIAGAWRDIFYRFKIVKDLRQINDGDVLLHRIYTKKNGEKVERIYKRVLKNTDVPYINFHALRHTTGTWMAQSGVNAKVIQSILGHANISTTNKYMHANDEDKKRALDKIF